MRIRSRLVLTAFLFPAALAAQKTWIVDASNGTGTNFTDLPAAFKVVADGDRVIVRKGRYTAGTLNKAIRLVAEPEAVVPIRQSEFLITGIGAGKTCAIYGLVFVSGGLLSKTVRVIDNDGMVVLSNVVIDLQGSWGGLQVTRSKGLTLTDSTVRPQLVVEDTEVSAARCLFGPNGNSPSLVGILAYNSRLDFAQCSAQGFNAISFQTSTEAIRARGSSLVFRGDANSKYLGGTHDSKPSSPSITGHKDSTLVVDPAVVLSPAPVNMASITKRKLPALYIAGGKLGGNLDVELFSPANHAYAVGVALPAAPFDLFSGRHWLDLRTEILLVLGKQGNTGFARHRYTVPSSPAFRGLTLGFQALTDSGTALTLTNPVVPMLH